MTRPRRTKFPIASTGERCVLILTSEVNENLLAAVQGEDDPPTPPEDIYATMEAFRAANAARSDPEAYRSALEELAGHLATSE